MGSNAFAVKPELPLPFPDIPDVWTCPITGLKVPKNPDDNLRWRAEILRMAQDDVGLQTALYTACSQSILFWVNAFVYTLRVFEPGDEGEVRQATHSHIPFVTWPIQDIHLKKLEEAIDDGKSLLTDKSRDMGASWSHIVAIHHQWLFRPDRLFLEMSRVENDVDGADNPKSLMVKHDYINKWLPEWMRPPDCLPGGKNRTRMHIKNTQNGSRIDGESSNKAAGSGDRRHAILLDEFAKMENSTKIKAATADVSPCRLVNSTPWGPGTEYSRWRQSGQIEVFTLPWWEHPEKGVGRYVDQDETTGKWKIRSPWYNAEEKKRSPREMAQEIDMDHIGSGDTYFEAHIIEQHKIMFGKEPSCHRTIDFKKGTAADQIPNIIARSQLKQVKVTPQGSWSIWPKLINGRLDQTKNYVMGIDISKGQGASNSVISVLCVETREKVAEFADANVPPYDLARMACAAALWIGGARKNGRPLMIWEANGPGWDFGRQVVRTYQYPFFYHDKQTGKSHEKRGKKYGWQSSREKKEIALGHYRRALAQGGFVNHCVMALDEALSYIYFENGGIGPACLLEESSEARKTHGDRVIADMLTLWGLDDAPRPAKTELKIPQNSIGYRLKEFKRDKQRRARQRDETFDFRVGV